MLTMKGKYGLKAMLHLAELPEGQRALSEEIASAHNISKKFLDAILGELRTAGMVHARKGRGGGYALSRPADEIRVGHVLRVLEGPLAPIPCASRTAYRRCEDCVNERVCSVRRIMLEVRNAISAVLDERTLADVANASGSIEVEFRELTANL
ncbi:MULTISPECIES: Rrf2 family transcriptional regulator [Aurantimonas]|uniref:Rrf2 family protein n=1 Tax=Aurantimonas endophytica TaxID=1522175 RepID=A0A7W6MNR3_9HYPH|nr:MULTISPECIES: Rrf2 family transcriptional regulator [Aurantimonas]MBB4002150.1 Rrf2 family protein [Aurantimonas endophytica]MCO6402220.1 Rrf2 family transcriptional regulator [Aurantimonas endophytica]UIJ70415.1 Rrf2 family transcriptional regulator [Aurantimonas sp. HBX-1]